MARLEVMYKYGGSSSHHERTAENLLYSGQAPKIFNIFPNGFNRGPYVLIFFNGF